MSHSELFAVTGAAGFVGRAVVATLRSRGVAVRPLVRHAMGGDTVPIGEIGSNTDWSRALEGVTHVIHAAARAHVMQEEARDPLKAYREVNLHGTRRLAEQAATAGVHRLVFVSSVKVNGERTRAGCPFSARDCPAPEDAYGISKHEAEQALLEIGACTALKVAIVRPPLVYGPGVKGNFARLIRWVRTGIPLPLAAVHNRRSLVALDNIVDLLICCAMHSRATGQVFLAGDGADLSTPELLGRIARAMNRRARLFPVPPSVLSAVARLVGRGAEVDRLIGSLQVDISHAYETLGWRPPVGIDECLAKTVSRADSNAQIHSPQFFR